MSRITDLGQLQCSSKREGAELSSGSAGLSRGVFETILFSIINEEGVAIYGTITLWRLRR